jgi:uncharacterized protein YggT (Ycf19 family)
MNLRKGRNQVTEKIIELLRESVIFQGLITLTVLVVWAVLQLEGRPVPQEVYTMAGVVVGFFFGGKYTSSVARAKKTDC